MLTEKIYNKMNEQVMLEFYSANLYLAMSSWCAKEGLNGAAKFLYAHSKEEMEHMDKLFHYINETGSHALIKGLGPREEDSF